MRILGLAASDYDPASRFRILQYKESLYNLGTTLECRFPYPPKESAPSKWVLRNQWLWQQCQLFGRIDLIVRQYFFDIIWQNRLLLNDLYSIERFYNKRKLVFDIDDAIWLTEGKKQVNTMIRRARIIFAGNEYLADYCLKENKNTFIIPSVIDTSVFHSVHRKYSDSFIIGWIGTESNFEYLDIIKEAILQFLRQTSNTKFIIVSSKKPAEFDFDNQRIIFQNWHKDDEVDLINRFDIGIMPLTNNEWTKGKCGYKILQYMSCEKPFIASPVGVNTSLLKLSGAGISASTTEEWVKAFNDLYHDTSLRKSLSQEGRLFVEKNYSCNIWAPRINDFFKTLA